MRNSRKDKALKTLKKIVKDLVLENRELKGMYKLTCGLLDKHTRELNENYISLKSKVDAEIVYVGIIPTPSSEGKRSRVYLMVTIPDEALEPIENWVIFSRDGKEEITLPPNIRRLTKKLSKYDLFTTSYGVKGVRIKKEQIKEVM